MSNTRYRVHLFFFQVFFQVLLILKLLNFLILVDELSYYTDDDDDYSDSEESRLLAIKCEVRMYLIGYDLIKFFLELPN